jgi:hypothetical protein
MNHSPLESTWNETGRSIITDINISALNNNTLNSNLSNIRAHNTSSLGIDEFLLTKTRFPLHTSGAFSFSSLIANGQTHSSA